MLFLFIVSGGAGLIYEIVWTRMLVLIFGNTLLASSTVLSAYMAGLALGSYLFGRRVDRKPERLVRLYALLEFGIAVFALLFPLLLSLFGPFYRFLYQHLGANLPVMNLARFSVCFLLILIPTFLMGGTLPILVKHFTRRDPALGRRMGLLYGLNTLGGVLGCLVCGFVLLRVFGMVRATLTAVVLNVLVALVALLLSLREGRGETGEEEAQPAPQPSAAAEAVSPRVVRLVLFGVAVSGFCSLAYEVFWTRMLTLFFRNTVYSFTTILATFLTGIALGSLIYSRWLSRRSDPVRLFILLEIAIALSAYATPYVFIGFHRSFFSLPAEYLMFAKAAAIMLLPTVLMGIALPLAVHICRRAPHEEGSSVGRVYALNTLGSILGSFAAGFVLIPLLGLHFGVIFLSAANLLAGFVVLVGRVQRRTRLLASVGGLVLAALMFLSAPSTLFYNLYLQANPHTRILSYREGRVANVVVYDFWKEGYKDLYLNGVEEASSRLWHVQLFKMLGVLPPLMHPQPENGLMVAFGAGMSAGASVDYVDSLECVELNPDIEGVANTFAHENKDVYHNPKFKLVVNDGRNHIFLTPKKYSVIISDATNPMSFDSWILYTREFYELCKSKLKPGGIFCQWVPIPLTADSIKIILKTFQSVYPHASFWVIHGSSQCLMLGTPERLSIDHTALRARLERIYDSSGMREFGIDSAEKFLSFFFCGEDRLREMLRDFPTVNTDDLPHAQFYGVLDRRGIQTSLDMVAFQETAAPYLRNVGDEAGVHRELDTLLRINKALNLGFLKTSTPEYEKALALGRELGRGEDANIRSMLNYDHKKREYFQDQLRRHPDDANAANTLGYIYMRERRFAEAEECLRRAIRLKPDFAAARANLALTLLEGGKPDDAQETLLELRRINPTNDTLQFVREKLEMVRLSRKLLYHPQSALLHKALADLHLRSGEYAAALPRYRQALQLDPGNYEIRLTLGEILGDMELEDQALQVLREGLTHQPGNKEYEKRIAALTTYRADPRRRSYPYASDTPLSPAEEGYLAALKYWNDIEFDTCVTPQRLRESVKRLEKVIKEYPKFMKAYAEAAVLYDLLDDHIRASVILESGLKITPNFAPAENQLRRQELLYMLQHEKLTAKETADIEARLGGVCMDIGEPEEAADHFRRALDAFPQDPFYQANVGLAEMEMGRYERAEELLRKAVQGDPQLAGRLQEKQKILDDILRVWRQGNGTLKPVNP